MITTWTRRTLFRCLTAMLYLHRTGDARTYWIILPKRLKVVRDRYEVVRRQMAVNSARMISEWIGYTFNNYRSFGDLIRSGQVEPISNQDFRIPFKITGDASNIKAGTIIPFTIKNL